MVIEVVDMVTTPMLAVLLSSVFDAVSGDEWSGSVLNVFSIMLLSNVVVVSSVGTVEMFSLVINVSESDVPAERKLKNIFESED
jgi:hypothetical protein